MLPRNILKEESLIAQLWSQAESYGYDFYEGLYLPDLCKGQSIDLVPINFYPLMQSLVTFLVEMLLTMSLSRLLTKIGIASKDRLRAFHPFFIIGVVPEQKLLPDWRKY